MTSHSLFAGLCIIRPSLALNDVTLFLTSQDYDAKDLDEFQETILRGCDFNRDGKINKKELTMILMALSKTNDDDNEHQ